VERGFAALTEKQLRRVVHRGTRELEAAIQRYVGATNAQPKPFGWTRAADDVVASIRPDCERISDVGR
jgi:Arc/MetJ family transcription regulator